MAAPRPVTPPPEPSTPYPSPAVAADGQAILEWLFSPMNYTVGRLGVLVTRPFGIPATSRLGAVVGGVGTAVVQFLLPLLAALATGELTRSPVATWALISGFMGLIAIMTGLRSQSTEVRSGVFALVYTLEHESDAHALLDYTRRRWRLCVNATFGGAVSVVSITAFALWASSAFDALPVGSIVLLGLFAFALGELAYLYISFMPGFLARLARAEHRLFWLSPLDAEPVRRTLQASGSAVGTVGVAVTLYIVLAAVVVGLDSSLVVPVVATFTAVGYLAVGTCLVAIRQSIRTLTRAVRDRHLRVLEDRIEAFGDRLAALTPAENDELRHLVETYRAVREMPTSPSTSETFGHAAKALVIPTLGLLIAVMSEVYAERLLDQFLP